jgi:ureidoacrylate peracid hydrolase
MTWPLPDELVARAVARRGRLEVFERIEPRRTALLVIDMQVAWTRPEGPMHVPTTQDIVPAINRLAASLRERGGRVVWVQHGNAPPDSPLYWATYYDNFIGPARRAASLRTLSPDSPLHALEPRLETHPADQRLLKYRFSALTNNPSDPEGMFRRAGIDTIIVAGVATNICCESTARDAMMRDFKVFMPHDAVTASTPDQHFAGLGSVMQVFADVRPTDALVDLIETR